MRSTAFHVAIVLLLGTGACSNYSQPGDTNVPVQGVKLVPQSVNLAIGETKQLQATIAPANATDQAVTWESTDVSKVSVNGTGLITAIATGSGVFVTVITHDGQRQASVNVSVNP